MLHSSPIRAHLADTLLYRQWSSYRDWQYSHLFSYDVEKGKIEAVTSGELDFPATSGGFSISPSGKEICVVGKEVEHPATSTDKDLFLISINSEEKFRVRLTAENKAADGAPQYSPDGKYIAYLMQRVPDYESDRIRLAIYDRRTKKRTVLTEDFDNWVNGFIWSSDSRYIYFKAQEKGRYPVYRLEVDSANIKRILDAHTPGSMVITPNGKEIIFTRYSFTEPGDIWSYRIGEKQCLRRLTFFNEKLEAQVDIRPAEEHWVTGAGGTKIHMFIIKPHDFDSHTTYPVILNIHGGPQQMWDDSFWGDYQVYPGSGYIIALPNLRGSVGYGQDFTAAISGDYGGKVMQDIEKVSDYLASLPYVDKDRMGAMGWSWGGYAIMWLEGHTQRFKALASMMGLYDLPSFYGSTDELWFPEWDLKGTPWENEPDYRRFSPSSYVKNFKTPCLVITGEKDYRVPYTQSLQFFTALQKMGVPSRLIVFPNDGHMPNPDSMRLYYNAHLEWFYKYLGGKPAPYNSEKMIRNIVSDEQNEY
jgi:dipeptidyl aminopeptidase/acylaminoacyl peptidase